MPHFVLLYNIDKDFQIEEFFDGLKIQYSQREKRLVFGTVEIWNVNNGWLCRISVIQ